MHVYKDVNIYIHLNIHTFLIHNIQFRVCTGSTERNISAGACGGAGSPVAPWRGSPQGRACYRTVGLLSRG